MIKKTGEKISLSLDYEPAVKANINNNGCSLSSQLHYELYNVYMYVFSYDCKVKSLFLTSLKHKKNNKKKTIASEHKEVR